MFCKHCGAQLPEGSQFCTTCGKSLSEAPAQQAFGQAAQPAPAPGPIPGNPAPATPVTTTPAGGKNRTLWWIFAGIALALLLASLIFLGVRALSSAVSSVFSPEDDIWIPSYVEDLPSDDWDDAWDDGSDAEELPDDWDDESDWNADGDWELGENYLYGEWVSDLYSDGTVEALYFDMDGYVELWEATPGAGDDLDSWYDGDWDKTFLYSGSYWTDGDYLTLSFDEWDDTVTYYVDMVSLFDIEIHMDDGSVNHFEQVSW